MKSIKPFAITLTSLLCLLWAQAAFAQFTVTDGVGKPVLVVTKGTTRFEVSGSISTLGSLKVESGKVNVYDAKGAKVGSVKKLGSDFTLDNATGRKIAKMSHREDGYRLKDASDKTLIKIKPREDGFKVGDDAGRSLAKAKKKGESIVLSSEQGTPLYKISGKFRADAAGVLVVASLTDLQKAAMILAVSQL